MHFSNPSLYLSLFKKERNLNYNFIGKNKPQNKNSLMHEITSGSIVDTVSPNRFIPSSSKHQRETILLASFLYLFFHANYSVTDTISLVLIVQLDSESHPLVQG